MHRGTGCFTFLVLRFCFFVQNTVLLRRRSLVLLFLDIVVWGGGHLLRFCFVLIQIHYFHCFSWGGIAWLWLNLSSSGLRLTHPLNSSQQLHIINLLNRLLLHTLIWIRLTLTRHLPSRHTTTLLGRCSSRVSRSATRSRRLFQNNSTWISNVGAGGSTFANGLSTWLAVIGSIIGWGSRTLLCHHVVHLIVIKRAVEIRTFARLTYDFQAFFQFGAHWSLTVFATATC